MTEKGSAIHEPGPIRDATERKLRRRVVVQESGCHEYQRIEPSQKYGRIWVTGAGLMLAHRVSWILANGPIPDGQFVCHSCDNPPCVNPEHLFIGSPGDNMRDMHAKGRANPVKGDDHWAAQLTADEVREIRERYVPGMRASRRTGRSSVELAHEFGVTYNHIARVAKGKKRKP